MYAGNHQVGDSCVGNQDKEIDDRFPIGMRVLAVDDDLVHLKILEASLRKCNYEVTAVDRATHALKILKENKNKFDMVISDVLMPEMDGFQLLQQLAHQMDLPVVMVSSSDDNELIKKGISNGACCYLVKPVNIQVFKTIWQHSFRRRNLNSKDQCKSFNQDKLDRVKEEAEDHKATSSSSEENKVHRKKRKPEIEDDDDENEDASTRKKHRITWTDEMKKQFEEAYNTLGSENAIPSKMLELMKNFEGLTRAHIASHLQKYREQRDERRRGFFRRKVGNAVDKDSNSSPSDMPRFIPVDEFGGRLFSNANPLRSWMPPNQTLPRSNYPTGILPNSSSHLLLPVQSANMLRSFNTSTMAGNPQQNHVTQGTDFYASSGFISSNARSFDINELFRASILQDKVGSNGERWKAGMHEGSVYQASVLKSDDSNFGTSHPNNFGASLSIPLINKSRNELYPISSAVELRGNVPTENQGHVAPSTYSTSDTIHTNWGDHRQGYNPSEVSRSDIVDLPTSQNLIRHEAVCHRSTNSHSFDQNPPLMSTSAVLDLPTMQTLLQNDAVFHTSTNPHSFDHNPSHISTSDVADPPISQTIIKNEAVCPTNSYTLSGDPTTSVHYTEAENSTMQTNTEPNEDYLLNQDWLTDDQVVSFDFQDVGDFGFGGALAEQRESKEEVGPDASLVTGSAHQTAPQPVQSTASDLLTELDNS